MSRSNRAAPPVPAGASGGTSAGAAVPVPVVQQAQQYLEENIRAWMEPVTPPTNSRGDILPLPLVGANAPAEAPPLPAHQVMGRPAMPPVTSPSSGYSEHSDPYVALSSSDRAALLLASKHFPHSLSFGGCSQHSLLQQGTSYSSPCGNSFGSAQPSAAASFFARAAQRLNLSAGGKSKKKRDAESKGVFRTHFRDIAKSHPPPVPPGLLRIAPRKDVSGVGKVKVMLRMSSESGGTSEVTSMSVDSRRKQVTLLDPTVGGGPDGESRVAAPKMFAFDAVFSPDDNQAEVCSSSLCDVITSVVGGADGCLFVYGHSKLGKTNTMIGNSASVQDLGVIPSAICWLFRAINEHKHRTGARFSVRVSAVEISGKVEELRDLLANYAAGTEGSGPGVYLRDDPVFGSQLMNQSELRAPSAERAAFLLDAALAARTSENDEDAKNSHFLFTLHVYQYRVEKGGRGGVAGGRSRLHLFDLGSCDKTTKSRDGATGGCLSLSALGNVILALFNGQKHVPYKDSKLTQLLREAMGSVMCRVAMIAHVSILPSKYPETLATLQLASRIHRLRRKKLKFVPSAELGPITDDKGVCRPFVKIHAVGEDGIVKQTTSDQDYTSSSEQSCETVIFVGSARSSPLMGNICDKRTAQPMSPLAKESHNSPNTSKKQIAKTHNPEKSSLNVNISPSAVHKDPKSEYVPKSALGEHLKTSGVMSSPKKKSASSSPYASPKHPKNFDSDSPKMSPKMSKYVMMDYSGADSKKAKGSSESIHKSSTAKVLKLGSGDNYQKPITVSTATGSPQSLRKSKRHKQETPPQQIYMQQQQAEAAMQILMKEGKPTSDETWIDGPRFQKPKFDSRTLHQLQREKWVDGPGMYGYMDVQKETMIRKWVEDHSRVVSESDLRKEVWIDFPPGKEDKPKLPSESSERYCAEKAKRDRYKPGDASPRKSSIDTEKKIYAKPSSISAKDSQCDVIESNPVKVAATSKDREDKGNFDHMFSDLENSINGNLSEILGLSEHISSSSGSVDFNDNNSEDLESHDILESNKLLSNSTVDLEDQDRCAFVTDTTGLGDNVIMADSCVQVTEEDIFTSCGWPNSYIENQHFSDTDSFEGHEHPLHVLSAEGLNLASSFTDSRASVDFDTLSVPEGWTPDCHYLDPDLTRRLLRGAPLPKHKSNESSFQNLNSTDDSQTKNNLLASKLERLANLRKMIEKSCTNQEGWKGSHMPDTFSNFCSTVNRYPFISKLHHSADSSLEELRENDTNSIHSEPAELDVDSFDFQFNVKPMNGLRLEAFYNKIQKVPLFPDCFSQFGKPTQVVPPTIQQAMNSKIPLQELSSSKCSLELISDKDNCSDSPFKRCHRWSGSSTKNPSSGAYGSVQSIHKQDCNTKLKLPSENVSSSDICVSKCIADYPNSQSMAHTGSIEKVQTLTEVIQEQRCRVYSEGPSCSPVPFHTTKYFSQRTSKSRIISEHSAYNKAQDGFEQRCDFPFIKKHQRKKGSPKLSPRNFLSSSRSKQSKQHLQYNSTSEAPFPAPEVLQSPGQKSQILIRSTSTPTNSEAALATESCHYMSSGIMTVAPTSILSKKESKWLKRHSSSGHGSDSSALSVDPKETKELIGKGAKTPHFSGMSSGYESMPRDSEGTPLSSSSQDSGSESGTRKEHRGRKGTRKKAQGSSKRSRSVPARPATTTGSPTWQMQQQQLQLQPLTGPAPIRSTPHRGRHLHDPALWKSEEDVCCTSLLCCRLLDFY